MSVQCPHCGGEFQVELTLSVPAVKHVEIPTAPPVQPSNRGDVPHFAVHTDAGKLRRAIYRAGYPDAARMHTIFNDKRESGRRLKMWTRIGLAMSNDEIEAVENAVRAEFGARVMRIHVSGTEILVYLNS